MPGACFTRARPRPAKTAHNISKGLALNGGTLASNGVSGNSDYQFAFDSTGGVITAGGSTTSLISASIGLNGTHAFNVGSGSTLQISGQIGNWENTAWGYINKTGAGILSLTYSGGNNNFGGLTLNGGTVMIVGSGAWANNGGPGGYLADFETTSTLQWSGTGNTKDISASSKLKIADGVTATLDTGGNNVTLGAAIVTGAAATGGLTKAGSGMLTLGAANTYSGNTLVGGGTLALGSALAIQNSTLDTSGSGALSFLGLTGATLGGLQGTGNLSLTNTASVAVSLTVGGNGATTALQRQPERGIAHQGRRRYADPRRHEQLHGQHHGQQRRVGGLDHRRPAGPGYPRHDRRQQRRRPRRADRRRGLDRGPDRRHALDRDFQCRFRRGHRHDQRKLHLQ